MNNGALRAVRSLSALWGRRGLRCALAAILVAQGCTWVGSPTEVEVDVDVVTLVPCQVATYHFTGAVLDSVTIEWDLTICTDGYAFDSVIVR